MQCVNYAVALEPALPRTASQNYQDEKNIIAHILFDVNAGVALSVGL